MTNDIISRQAVMDAAKTVMKDTLDSLPTRLEDGEEVYDVRTSELDFILNINKALQNAIKSLPSAQPEIIRCTECKHYREYDSKYVENAVVVQCMADRYPISETIPDGWFCAGAERKDDE